MPKNLDVLDRAALQRQINMQKNASTEALAGVGRCVLKIASLEKELAAERARREQFERLIEANSGAVQGFENVMANLEEVVIPDPAPVPPAPVEAPTFAAVTVEPPGGLPPEPTAGIVSTVILDGDGGGGGGGGASQGSASDFGVVW